MRVSEKLKKMTNQEFKKFKSDFVKKATSARQAGKTQITMEMHLKILEEAKRRGV